MTVSNVQTDLSPSFSKATPVKDKGNKDQSFQSIMDLGTTTKTAETAQTNASDKKIAKDAKANDTLNQTNANDKATPKKVDSTTSEGQQKKVVEEKDIQQEPSNQSESEVIAGVLTSAINDAKQMIMDNLSIDEDQLDQMLENMGLNLIDLLNPQTMAKLVVDQNELSGAGELLNNPELTDLVKDLNVQLEDILSNHDLSISEEGQLQTFVQGEPKDIVVSQMPVQEPSVQGQKTNDTAVETNEPTIAVSIASEEESQSSFSSGNESHFSNQDTLEDKQNTPEPITLNGNQILQNLNQKVETIFTEKLTTAQQTDVVNQLLEAVKVNVKADMTTMELQLNPASLGKVQVQVASKDGVMTAQINTQTEAAKNAIETQLISLKESFQNQGLKVEAVEVSVSPHSFGQQEASQGENENTKDNKSRRKLNLNLDDLDSMDNLTEEEEIAAQLMKENGNQVDYSA